MLRGSAVFAALTYFLVTCRRVKNWEEKGERIPCSKVTRLQIPSLAINLIYEYFENETRQIRNAPVTEGETGNAMKCR